MGLFSSNRVVANKPLGRLLQKKTEPTHKMTPCALFSEGGLPKSSLQTLDSQCGERRPLRILGQGVTKAIVATERRAGSVIIIHLAPPIPHRTRTIIVDGIASVSLF